MIKISEEKWEKLPKVEDHLSEKYGPVGSASRKEFQAKAEAWYYAELLREERKRQKITQKELGERIGKKREYISALEQGQTDAVLIVVNLGNLLQTIDDALADLLHARLLIRFYLREQ